MLRAAVPGSAGSRSLDGKRIAAEVADANLRSMAAEYPVHVVTREQRAKSEPMGSKEKFWVRRSDGTEWLFKFPAVGTGGHWAEKIAYEVARRLGISAAEVELATWTDPEGKDLQGSVSRSFTESDARGPSPLEVVRGCLAHPVYHAFFDDVCRRVASAPTSLISSRAIERVPSGWMTCTARQFAIGLLQHNHRQLREMVE